MRPPRFLPNWIRAAPRHHERCGPPGFPRAGPMSCTPPSGRLTPYRLLLRFPTEKSTDSPGAGLRRREKPPYLRPPSLAAVCRHALAVARDVDDRRITRPREVRLVRRPGIEAFRRQCLQRLLVIPCAVGEIPLCGQTRALGCRGGRAGECRCGRGEPGERQQTDSDQRVCHHDESAFHEMPSFLEPPSNVVLWSTAGKSTYYLGSRTAT